MRFVFFESFFRFADIGYSIPINFNIFTRFSIKLTYPIDWDVVECWIDVRCKCCDGVVASWSCYPFGLRPELLDGLHSQWNFGRNVAKCPASLAIFSTNDGSVAKSL